MTSSSGSDVNKDGVKDGLNSSPNGSLLEREKDHTIIRKTRQILLFVGCKSFHLHMT